MSTQSTVGGAVLATAVGVGTAGESASGALGAQTLALTGASHTMLLVTLAILMIIAGVLLDGLCRRHRALAGGGISGGGPPLRL